MMSHLITTWKICFGSFTHNHSLTDKVWEKDAYKDDVTKHYVMMILIRFFSDKIFFFFFLWLFGDGKDLQIKMMMDLEITCTQLEDSQHFYASTLYYCQMN